MIIFNLSFLVVFLVCIITSVGFDAVLHGLSHGSHNLVQSIWVQEKHQRTSSPIWFGSIQWHIFADFLIGLSVSLLSYISYQADIGIWTVLLVILSFGLLSSSYYFHIYSAYEVSERSAFGLAALAFLQIILTAAIAFLLLVIL